MIIPNEIRPELSLYYIGAKILVNISKFNSECNAFELFENMKQMNTNYSLNQHLMALNWLHLLGVLHLTQDCRLRLC
mgnify:CR=1 FL=1